MTLNDVILPKKEQIEERPKPRIAFWCFLVGFMALVYVRNIIEIEYPIELLLVYVGAMALFCDRDELVALAISFIPFSSAFQYKYAIVIIIIVYMIKFYSDLKKINIFAFLPLLAMLGWELLHGILGAFSFTEYFRGFAELIFCSFILALPKKRYDLPFISRVLAITVAFSCAVLLLILLEQVNYDFLKIFEDGNYRLGLTDEWPESYIMNYNANGLGFMCNMSVAGLLLRIKQKKITPVDIILIIALVFFGTLTLSRSYVICLALVFILYVFSSGVKLGKVVKNTILVVFSLIALFFIVNLIAPYIIDNIIERFSEEDVTGGRAELLVWYFDYLFAEPSHILFGTGMQDIFSKVTGYLGSSPLDIPHNGIQELLVVWGLPGIILLGVFMFNLVAIASRANKISFPMFIPVIVWFVMGMSGQWITSGKDMLFMSWFYVVFCSKFEDKIGVKK